MSLYQTGVRQVIDDFLLEESKKKRNYNGYFSASSAGYCMRKNLFEVLGVPPVKEDARKQRVFTAGHLFHEWIQKLTQSAGISISQEGELVDDDLNVIGHYDDLVLIDNKQILYDYKTASSRSFGYKKELSHYHKMQLGTYVYLLRKSGYTELVEARILVLEKDTLRTKEFVLHWTPQLEKEVVGYWRTMKGYLESRKLPKCTCADHEGGFMARENYNPFYYEDEPCSLAWLKLTKEKGLWSYDN
jgi:hypothetical protein